MRHDIQFPRMALGTWTFAGDAIWDASDEQESVSVIHAALDMGITLFDSSPNYGNGRSESILGKALADRPEALVATKTKIQGLSRDALRAAVEGSLKRLGREAIDLMQIHWPGTPEETAAALELFMEMRQEGKIRAIGVCNFGVYDLKETVNYPIISNQLPYNLLWRTIEQEIAPLSQEMGKKVWVYSPLQQGLLTGEYSDLTDFPSGRKRTRHYASTHLAANHGEAGMEAETQSALMGFLKIAEETGIGPLELGLRYIMSHSFIDTLLVGARSVKQLADLYASSEGSLDPSIIEQLDAVSQPLLTATKGNPDMYQSVSRVRY